MRLILATVAAALVVAAPVEARPAHPVAANIAKVWDADRWQRGQPKASTLAWYRRTLAKSSPRRKAAIKQRWRRAKRSYYRHRAHQRYCRSGEVYEGRVSYFTDGITASGLSAATNAGMAINPVPGTGAWNSALTQGWMTAARNGTPVYVRVSVAGRTGIFPILDVGPHSSVGRALDFSGPAVDALGLSRSSFPTDSWGTARVIPPGC